MSLNIIENRLFQKTINEILFYYLEIIEEKNQLQKDFVNSLFKKLIWNMKKDEKIIIIWNQLTAFLIKVIQRLYSKLIQY